MRRSRIQRRRHWSALVGAALAGAALVVGVSGDAAAGKGAKVPALAAGGRTIAGPGTLVLAQDEWWEVWSAESDMAVCVTALNAAGSTAVELKSGNVTSSTRLGAGEQTSICDPAREAFALYCEEGPCSVSWRVDQMR